VSPAKTGNSSRVHADSDALMRSDCSGDNTKDKPWLIRLRREFIRRDPKHNKLGDGPISLEEYWEDEEPVPRSKQGSQVPLAIDAQIKSETMTPQPEITDHPSSSLLAPPAQNSSMQGQSTPASADSVAKSEADEKRVLLPHEWTESYGWEDLTLKEQVRSYLEKSKVRTDSSSFI
jgi:hypothetical protein